MERIKVRIITASELVSREIDFFCLEELSLTFDIEYWDCSSFLFPNFKVPGKVHQMSYLRVISSLNEFENQLNKLPYNTVVVVDVFANQHNFKFYKILCKYFPKYLTAFFSTNTVGTRKVLDVAVPNIWIKNVWLKFKNLILSPFVIRKLALYLRYHGTTAFQKKMDSLYASEINRMSDVTIMACMKGFDKRINHPDYEKYLMIKDDERIVNGKYIVFIDEYFPYLNEVKMVQRNIDLEKAASLYYASLNHFFDGIEKEYGYQIIIAAHPRSNYSQHNPFGGRLLFYHKTANLIKDCEAVCIHNSNCFSYVALYDKPVVAMINNGWRMSSLFTKYVEDVTNRLSLPLTDTDLNRVSYKGIFMKLSPSVREEYIDTYLCDIYCQESNKTLFTRYYTEFYNHLIAKG